MMGVDKLSGWLAHFGLGQPTDIDIGGERKGILPTPGWKKARFKNPADQVWFPGETVSFGIGQGYLIVTPLQARAHDVRSSPRAARVISRASSPPSANRARARSSRSRPNYSRPSKRSPENWKVAVDGMVKVMTGPAPAGAARSAREYQIAGKTGTAQVFTVGQNESYKRWRRSSTNACSTTAGSSRSRPRMRPKLAVAVIIENGKHGTAAAPIARRVLDQYLLGHTTTPEIPPPVIAPTGAVVVAPTAPGDE